MPIDGSASPIKLNGTVVGNGGVNDFQISENCGWIVYVADQDADWINELYSVPLDGSTPPIQLNSALPNGGSLGSFQISADSQYVIYLAEQDTVGLDELYSTPQWQCIGYQA
ncbi:MAG: hypothetical protein IPF56_13395 [Chloroflexi bacterium]|nr:hypothetical protein [Chloroflexota bacterium]